MKRKNFKEMTKEIVSVFKAYDKTGTKMWTYKTAVVDLSYQVGSLTKIMMQMKGERFAHGKTLADLKKAAGDELADILAEVLFIAHGLGINIEEAWELMIKTDRNKIATRSK